MNGQEQLQRSLRLLQGGHAAQALQAAEALVQNDAGNARVHLVMGIALRMLGRRQESRDALEHAARLAPSDYAIAFELGTTCEVMGEPQAALAQYERAAQLRPTFAPAHFAVGLRRFEGKEWTQAASAFESVIALDAGNAAARVNLGLALLESGAIDKARRVLETALALEPGNAAAHHAMGRLLHREGRTHEALAAYEVALAAAPHVSPWQVDRAQALCDLNHDEAAVEALVAAVRADAGQVPALRQQGHRFIARGEFEHAATLFEAAFERAPQDVELPMFLAQMQLLLGRWREGWRGYARREHRRRFEAERAAVGRPYRVPSLGELDGRRVALMGEQGLGDMLFFLRFAPGLRDTGARLLFAGDARLHPLLARSGLFEELHADWAGAPEDAIPILLADLPLVVDDGGPPYRPSLSIAPDADRLAACRHMLESFGQPPWVGVTWRAGVPREVFARGLYKEAPIEPLFTGLRRVPGTIVALQRGIEPRELELARKALGRPVHDLSRLGDDLEDLLAAIALLDRHIAVSSTNLHLAALAGRQAEVLVPFPPEWRWGAAGDSPWFPRMRVLRQEPSGDWGAALAAITR